MYALFRRIHWTCSKNQLKSLYEESNTSVIHFANFPEGRLSNFIINTYAVITITHRILKNLATHILILRNIIFENENFKLKKKFISYIGLTFLSTL